MTLPDDAVFTMHAAPGSRHAAADPMARAASSQPRLLDHLRAMPVFARLTPAELAPLAAQAVEICYPAHGLILAKGEPAEHVLLVLAGHVVLYLDRERDPASVARIVGPGEMFGETCLHCGGMNVVSAEAAEPSTLLLLPNAALRTLLEQRFDVLLMMLGQMSVQLRGLVRQVSDLKMKTAAQRLASYLADHATRRDGPVRIRLPYEKKLLARELGMQPETLSRALMKLRAVGVRWERQLDLFLVADIAVLRAYCDADDEHA